MNKFEIIVNSIKTDSDALENCYQELLSRITERNEEALAEFYDATSSRVYAVALRFVRHAQAAEEVVSDVYLQVWQQAQRYSELRGKVITWLLTITRSRALDWLRRQEQAETHPEPALLRNSNEGVAETPLNILEYMEKGKVISNAMECLKPGQRELIALAFFKGLTHQEIATHTGRPLGSVKTDLRNGLQQLKSLLADTPFNRGKLS